MAIQWLWSGSIVIDCSRPVAPEMFLFNNGSPNPDGPL